MTTNLSFPDYNSAPDIVLSRDEHRLLTVLAMSGIDHTPDESDTLMHELERARVVPDSAVPNDIVRMGSVVFYRTASGEQRAVQIVLPKDADIAQGRISIMTPVGIALIGLRTGSSISWRTRNGRKEVLTVLGVVGPRGGGDPGPVAA